MGVGPRGREAKSFEDAVYGQEIGAIGEVVESPVGFHVVKVLGEQDEQKIPFAEIKDRLVAFLKSRAQQKVAADYVKGLRERATIKLDGPLAHLAGSKDVPAEEKPSAGILETAPVTAPVPQP